MSSWGEPGLSHVGAYQVSGQPYATGSINCKLDARPITDCVIDFPYVARWVKIINKDTGNDCTVAFSIAGTQGSGNFFTVERTPVAGAPLGDSGVLELKVSRIVISGSNNVDVVAGLTNIAPKRTATDDGPSWSGSAGVG